MRKITAFCRQFRPLLCACSLALVATARPVADKTIDQILTTPIGSFARDKLTIGEIVETIATGAVPRMPGPVGFEWLPEVHPKLVSVSVNEDAHFKDLLDALVRADPRYEWSAEDNGGIIDIYARNTKERFLDTKIPHFTVVDKTRSAAVDQLTHTPEFTDLLARLHARLRTMIGGSVLGGPGGAPTSNGGPKINLDLNNAPIREILNAIVVDSKGRTWSGGLYGDHLQYFALGVG